MTPAQVAIATAEWPEGSAIQMTAEIGKQVGIPPEKLRGMEYAVSSVIMSRRDIVHELFRVLGTADDITLRSHISRIASELVAHPIPRFFQ